MNWVDIVVIIILIISFFGGLKESGVKSFFSLVALLIAIPVAGRFYYLVAGILSFLPGTNWEGFLGFFITMGIVSFILYLIFLIPRKIIEKIPFPKFISRLVGAVLNTLGAAIGLTVFVLVLGAYPIFDWLERWVSSSGVLTSLAAVFSFVQLMLPEVLRQAAASL
jgi:uncharacterized membrane protein required for colicin V production